jgi:two-component system sensor histidine kinase/response regulator
MNTPQTHILIIDDEEALRDGCRQSLEKSGYHVLTTGDGIEGIQIARELKPDVVFVDLKMPCISGMEIIEILSKDMPDMVLIIITGYATIVSAVEAMQKGAYDYLAKPFSPDQLRAVTRRGVDHHNLKIETQKLREEKQRMEQSFITFVSHEMRSPLVVIRQYIEALKAIAGDRFDKDVQEIIERCSTRIQDLEKMIEHWLDIGRIGEGTFAGNKESLSMAGIIEHSAQEMAPILTEKGIVLETDIPEKLPSISGDGESLIRVFINLIGNAAKYTPESGRIFISAAASPCYVTVSIADTGTGIPADKLPFIFEPFFRVKGKEEQHKGYGLGLTFCKKIMEAHKGDIHVTSEEGSGTTFLLTFPVSSESSPTEGSAVCEG